MYTYVSAIGRNTKNNNTWESFDLNRIALKDLFKTYSEVYVTVLNSFSKKNEVLQLSKIQNKINTFNFSFRTWLTRIGNQALPTKGNQVSIVNKTVKRSDLVKANWKMKPVTKTGSPNSNDASLDRDWIFLQKEGVNYAEAFKYMMVSVNGYYHRLDGSTEGIWIADGMKTVERTNDAHLSVLSFKDLGSLEYIDITDNMIYTQSKNAKLYDQCFINIGKSTINKTIILVVAGYMYILDWLSFRRVGERQIKIDFKNIPLLKRLHEASHYLDLSSLDWVNDLDETHGAVDMTQFRSDEFIRKLLKLPQSFIVLLNNHDVYLKKHNLLALPAPGRYISHIEPVYPMVTGTGMAGEYWDVYDDGEWAVSTHKSPYYRRRYMFVDMNDDKVTNLNEADDLYQRTEFAKAHLLEIGSNQVVIT